MIVPATASAAPVRQAMTMRGSGMSPSRSRAICPPCLVGVPQLLQVHCRGPCIKGQQHGQQQQDGEQRQEP